MKTVLLSTDLIRAAFELVPFAVAITDPIGNIQWLNPAYARLSGATRDSLLGTAVLGSGFGPRAHEAVLSGIWQGETEHFGPDGAVHRASTTVTPLMGESGEVAGFCVTRQEIGTGDGDSRPSRSAEAQLSALTGSTQDLVLSVDLDCRLLTFNPAVERYLVECFGIRPNPGMQPHDLLPPSRVEQWMAFWERALSQGSLQCEYQLGDQRIVEVTINPIVQDGTVTGMSIFGRDITERKLAEQTLRQAEDKYRQLYEGALEGIYRSSPRDGVLEANPALAKILGYDSPEDVVANLRDIGAQFWADPNERPGFLALVEREGVVRDYETRCKRKDGSIIWISLNTHRVSGEDPGVSYHAGFIQDITARKRVEEALRKSEEKFAKAFLCSPASMAIVDLESGRLLEISGAFEHVTGYSRGEAIGKTVSEIGLCLVSDVGEQLSNHLRSGSHIRNFEHRFRRKDGAPRIGLTSAELIELDGKACQLTATIDITDQKKSESELRSLATAIEHAEDQIIVTDLNGLIQYCNPAFERISGYSKEEAIGKNPRMLKSGKHDLAFYRDLWMTLTRGDVWQGQMINRGKNGSFYHDDATISPITDSSGGRIGYVAVKRDVTARQEVENQLRQAQKMESIGRLAGGVAHDFNNLLTIINGYSEFLLSGLSTSDPLHSYALEIDKAGNRAASLTRQLLAFSRKQVIKPRVLNINAAVGQAEPMLRRLIGEDIVLETRLSDSLGAVMADADQLHQVILNLAINSRDAMPDGGRLSIQTANGEIKPGQQRVSAGAIPGHYVVLVVRDTGHGMDEATKKRIFEPFFTTKEVGKGTGLGLAMVYGTIHQSGGWVEVESVLHEGTTVRIFLPRIDAGKTEAPLEAAKKVTGGETILVVEDQESVRTFIRAALRQFGYSVIDAENGEAALDLVRRRADEIHLVLTDVVMPGMTGKVLAEQLRRLHRKLKVLFMSGYSSEIVAQRGVWDDGMGYIAKPFAPAALAGKVRDLLNG